MDICHKNLEDKFFSYTDLIAVPIEENGEAMVMIDKTNGVRTFCLDPDMRSFTGSDIFVRDSVLKKLELAQSEIEMIWQGASLEVVYGYRHIDIQTGLFVNAKSDILKRNPKCSEETLNEQAHIFIAVPEVAGHPTGGAVDVRIVTKNGAFVDMGTAAHDFSKASYVFSPLISKETWQNRQLLRASMVKAGFAPYDGEWWHFSYGDREWAAYYRRNKAVYGQIKFCL
ncbi:MAG TPA: hypothetical protein DCY07_02385 [Rhodospirillaceae bacterium]|nr:hypothetical protein [Rhodospirillaceae bacterium]